MEALIVSDDMAMQTVQTILYLPLSTGIQMDSG